ncbi:MAG: hypothetical protein ACP5IL_17705 [Syntrophobacteraceae bacterium]
MNQWVKKLFVSTLPVLLVGGTFGFALADQSMNKKPDMQPKKQQRSKPNLNSPQSKAQQKNVQSVTGKVTSAGGLIAQNGTKYRLNGAKAAGLRKFENKTVTIEGYKTKFEGHNAIDVQSFRTGKSQMAQNNMKQPGKASNFRSKPKGQAPPQPGQTGYKPKHNQHPVQNR